MNWGLGLKRGDAYWYEMLKTIDMKKLVLLLFGLFGMVCGMRGQVALPYYEDFEHVSAMASVPGGWLSLGGSGVTSMEQGSAHSGQGSMKIFNTAGMCRPNEH